MTKKERRKAKRYAKRKGATQVIPIITERQARRRATICFAGPRIVNLAHGSRADNTPDRRSWDVL